MPLIFPPGQFRPAVFANTLLVLATSYFALKLLGTAHFEPVSLILQLLAAPVAAVLAQLYHIRSTGNVCRGRTRVALVVLGTLPTMLLLPSNFFFIRWAIAAGAMLAYLWLFDSSRASSLDSSEK